MPAKNTTAKSITNKRKNSTAQKANPTKKIASPKSRSASSKGKAKTKAGEKEVAIDRRRKDDRREETTETAATPAEQPPLERREKVQRRRQIDPTTCERDYSEPEVQFMSAMDEYKRTSGRMFPTCSEVLEVLRNLGYVQLTSAEMAIVRPDATEQPIDGEEVQNDLDEAELEEAELAC